MPDTIAPLPSGQFYQTRLGCYDEMLDDRKSILPHWQSFFDAVEKMGAAELELRRQEAQRLLRENGVTYTVYSDNRNLNRPWQLDPIPLLISAQEWSAIERGLKQRAELLNLIFRDLYGKQLLLKKGRLPAELVYSHQGFLPPCVGSLSETERLTIYAANLARGPNGRMWVLNDHSQAPSGIGYSLENRSVMVRVMADLFRESHVQRFTGFFNCLQKSLAQSAPHNKDDPHIVVLTPGPLNETYFEHAYLASQLGFTLAQGEDLTVRDGKVWLRTLAGLQAVDVLVRRVDDSYCDPLELRSSSHLGIAGLLQAVRCGNVGIANPLGSSILENQGLLAFLPGLCRYLLNEDLLLPSVATWWCGQDKEREFVIKNLSRLTIKSINRNSANPVIFGNTLTQAEIDDLQQKIRAKPYLYLGQEQITFSTVPSLGDGRIEARHSILRCFAVAAEGSYQLMPGGLTRVAADKHQVTVSNQSGALSKDTWVLAEQQSFDNQTLVGQNLAVPAITEPLSSRAADNLFWVGRHFERVLSTVRLLRITRNKQVNHLAADDRVDSPCLQVMLRAVTHLTGTYPGFTGQEKLSLPKQQQEITSLLKDAQRNGTIAASIQNFFHAALNIRDLWSQDTWHCIDAIRDYWQDQVIANGDLRFQPSIHLRELSIRLAAFIGLTAESMTRESGWVMLQLGRKLERSLALIALLRATVVQKRSAPEQGSILEAVLLTTDSLSIYQRRYRSVIRLPMLLELLLQDHSHPYSLAFQLQHISDLIGNLPKPYQKNQLNRQERLILKAFTDLRLCEIADLLDEEDSGVFDHLDGLLANTADLLMQMSDSIAQTYFNHVPPVQQLMPTRLEELL